MWILCSCSTSPEVEVVVRPPQPRQHLVVVQGVVPHDVKLDPEHWSVVTLSSLYCTVLYCTEHWSMVTIA